MKGWKDKHWQLPLLFLLLQPFVPISEKFLIGHFDNFSQNFFRFLAGSVAMLALYLIFKDKESKQEDRPPLQLWLVALLVVDVVLVKVCFLEGLVRSTATTAKVFSLLSIPFTIVLAVLLFHDEREMIANRRFFVGTLLAVVGAFGMVLCEGGFDLEYSSTAGYFFLAMIFSSLFYLISKRLVKTSQPLLVGLITTIGACVLFFIGAVIWGDLGKIFQVHLTTQLVLFGSGAYGLAIGMGLGLLIVKRFGVVLVTLLTLATPSLVAVFEYLLLGEALTVDQIGFGAAAVLGSFIVLWSKENGQREIVPVSPETLDL
ncbi:DMT family transporter [Oligoflexia bacterium]|nr:DMT family transporter [Oligoflexia bacterium]